MEYRDNSPFFKKKGNLARRKWKGDPESFIWLHLRINWGFYEDRISSIHHREHCLYEKGNKIANVINNHGWGVSSRFGCLTLYIKSWEPEPMDILHPSFFCLPWLTSCNPEIQSSRGFQPAVSPYCKAWERSSPSTVNVTSSWGFKGDLAVKLNDVNGKVDGFGFPASNEISPGVFSKGKRLRTESRQFYFFWLKTDQFAKIFNKEQQHTWTRFPFLSEIGKKAVVVGWW